MKTTRSPLVAGTLEPPRSKCVLNFWNAAASCYRIANALIFYRDYGGVFETTNWSVVMVLLWHLFNNLLTFTSFSALYDYESGLLGWKWGEFNVWFYQGKLYIDRSVDKIKIKHKIFNWQSQNSHPNFLLSQ